MSGLKRLIHAIHRRIRGLSSPWRADPVMFMEDLWIDNEKETPEG